MLETAQQHYYEMAVQLRHYYQARKKLLDTKAKKLREQVNMDALHAQVDELKQAVEDQRRHWKQLMNQLKQHA